MTAQANPLFDLEEYTSDALRSEIAQLQYQLGEERRRRHAAMVDARASAALYESFSGACDNLAAENHRLRAQLWAWRALAAALSALALIVLL
jgi:hypothetical protein